jgi:sulfane dehydrogenase subunit SoxC
VKRREFLTGAAAVLAASRLRAGEPDPSRAPGGTMNPLSERARPEHPRRSERERWQGMALTPLEELDGTITPSDLHFTRHHAGIPEIDPARFRLLVHGLVERPLVFTLAELRRLPARSRVAFVECSGNGLGARRDPRGQRTPGDLDGATSNSEWTGVPLRVLLDEAGVKPSATWMLAQAQDGARYSRSLPLARALDEGMVAWAQNGEPLRAEQGYPARLLVPGWEGSAQVKWLRRLELTDGPQFTREETSRYSDLGLDGKVHGYRLEMEVKSVITQPAWPRVLERGWWEIRGLAWSGRGRIARVEVSTDGGMRWSRAALDEPVLPKAHTRFRLPWRFAGEAALLMSRAVDETGRVQPLAGAAPRQPGGDYHNNEVRAWSVEPDGRVRFEPGA